MNSQQKIINLLTICRRAGKAVIGFDAVCEAIKKKQAFCVMVASDISANTLKEISFLCNKYNVKLLSTSITKNEYSFYLRKQTAVIAVCDGGFSKRFAELSESQDELNNT